MVTNLTLLRDRQPIAVVVEGWAFNPERSAPDVADLISDGR